MTPHRTEALLTLLRPACALDDSLECFTTSRAGGRSSNPFATLNMGLHVGDQSSVVIANRELVYSSAQVPSQQVWLQQVHGANIVVAEEGLGSLARADGIYTRQSSLACCVLTADCLPVVLYAPTTRELAVLHAGWRGIAAGIIEQGVAMFQAKANLIHSWIGPGISVAHFEVGQEVIELTNAQEKHYQTSQSASKYYLDLPAVADSRLAKLGVLQRQVSKYCTFANADQFFSYRRDGETGRMATIAWIKKEL